MKTLYLHIGTPKTGTTSLQGFCAQNVEALHAQGFEYPLMPFRWNAVGYERNGAFLARAFHGRTEADRAENIEKMKRGFEVLVEAFQTYDNVLLSDEGLWSALAEGKERFWEPLLEHSEANGYAIKVIVYLRRQDKLALSRYNQFVKAAEYKMGSITLEEWLEGRGASRMDYHGTLERIAAHVGRENIIVRVYDRATIERESGDIYTDFFKLLGIVRDDSFSDLEDDANSETLTPNFLAIQRIVNGLPGHTRYDLGDIDFRMSARKCSAEPGEMPRTSLLSTEGLRDLMARYEEGNDLIARDYLHRDGPLFDTKMDEVEKWTPDNPWICGDVVRYFEKFASLNSETVFAARAKRAAADDGKAQEPSVEPVEAGPEPALSPDFASCLSQCAGAGSDGDGNTGEPRPVFECVVVCFAEFFIARNKSLAAGGDVLPVSGEAVACLVQETLEAGESIVSARGEAYVDALVAADAKLLDELSKALLGQSSKFMVAQDGFEKASSELEKTQAELAECRKQLASTKTELAETRAQRDDALRRTPSGMAHRAAGAIRHPSRIYHKISCR